MTELVIKTSQSLWSLIAASIEQTVVRYKEWRRVQAYRARIAKELSFCTDRDLADMGLSRGDIPSIINEIHSC